CIANRNGCQPDGSQGNCCSGYCHKEPGWVAGYCR
uniref:Antimicrobial peptide Alo-2 n=2 Tax=Endopterygota TaxID=33392 RepID=ALO2_ACRLO|nr:RecName: Full=Antimicrobial peptide Alo-2 [Acrocinus longimanus]